MSSTVFYDTSRSAEWKKAQAARLLELREYVSEGGKWLDENRPGWETNVDIDTLELKSACRCVLGQVYEREANHNNCGSGYEYGRDRMIGSLSRTRQLGFVLGSNLSDYAHLNRYWREEIRERRERNQ